jgi:hypothetical protein
MRGSKACKAASLVSSVFLIVFFALLFFFYSELKRTFISALSEKASTVIGQKVIIDDISFSFSGGLNVYNLHVENPEDFGQGNEALLRLEKIFCRINLKELLKGRFYFREITVFSPELTLRTNETGGINVSDRLRHFFSRKKTAKYSYKIDEFRIISGVVDFHNSIKHRNLVDLNLKNISSEPDSKTLIDGELTYQSGARLILKGWTIPGEDRRKVDISISSKQFSLALLKSLFERYGIEAGSAKADIHLHARGDTVSGIKIDLESRIMNAGHMFPGGHSDSFYLKAAANYNIPEDSLHIDNISLKTGDDSQLLFAGVIRDLSRDPSYSAEIKVGMFTLPPVNVADGISVDGVVNSDGISLTGKLSDGMPRISGSLSVKDASINADSIDFRDIRAKVTFLPERDISIKAKIHGKVLNTAVYSLEKPADFGLTINAEGRPEKTFVASTLDVSHVSFDMEKVIPSGVDSMRLHLEGFFGERKFQGKGSFIIAGLSYSDIVVNGITSTFDIDYGGNALAVKDIKMETDKITVSSGLIEIVAREEERKTIITVNDINAASAEDKIGFRDLDLTADILTGRKSLSGRLAFSNGKIIMGNDVSAVLSGSVTFDEEMFVASVSEAVIAGGRLTLTARGRSFRSPFPFKADLIAENIDLAVISDFASRFSSVPYSVSGILEKADLKIALASENSSNGHASVSAKKISLLKKEGNRSLLRDASLEVDSIFRGNEIEFKAEPVFGGVSPILRGHLKNYFTEDRHFRVGLKIPEIDVNEIRNSFWDIFPDSLLYAGLGGSVETDIVVEHDENGLKVDGEVQISDFTFEDEYGKYALGPVNGLFPVSYRTEGGHKTETLDLSRFNRSEFDNLVSHYSEKMPGSDYSRIRLGSFSYGFRLIEDIDVWIKQEGRFLNIGSISGKIFGGKIFGSATVDVSDGRDYRGGLVLRGLSLTELCDDIEPIRGYISGKVDGVAVLRGSSAGISDLLGRANFWTYSDAREKTRISKEFLKRVGGPSVKAYLGDRGFDRGVMSLFVKQGFLIFDELEVSNRNFIGIKDLTVKVAPLNNRISIDHLMWTMVEAAQRAKESKKQAVNSKE